MVAGFPHSESKRKKVKKKKNRDFFFFFGSLISEVTSYHFKIFLFVRFVRTKLVEVMECQLSYFKS